MKNSDSTVLPAPRTPKDYSRGQAILWFTLLTALAGAAAYLRIMTDFSPWDDEGTILFTVKQYMSGMKAYDQILSPYGPVYYFYEWVLHTATATPVTHDVVRMSSLLPWLGTALISAWITLRLTRSILLAALVHLAVSLALGFFKDEPGHPQELTVLLLVVLLALPVMSRLAERRMVLMISLGALPALLFLIKINIGTFAAAAVAMTLLSCAPRTRGWRLMAWSAAAACTILPVILMRSHLDAEWARSYCWLVMASVAGCACCLLWTGHRSQVIAQDCMLAVGGFAVAFTFVVAILLAQGVSMTGTYDCLFAAPARIYVQERTWFRVPGILKGTSVWALAGLGTAVFASWKQPPPESREWRVLYAGKLLFCALAVLTILYDRPLLSIVTPFAWLILFEPNPAGDQAQSLPRRLLAIVAVIQTLYAYPIAGSQAAFIQIPLLIVVGVCVGDSFTWLRDYWRPPQVLTGRVAVTASLAAVALLQVRVVVDRYGIYQSLPSIDLPGARMVHLAPEAKANYHWLVDNLKQRCDSFESLPGLPSLSFWTGTATLTRFNIGAWTYTLSPDQQLEVLAALSSRPGSCVVYNPRMAEFWNPGGKSLERLPLVAYMLRNFESVGASGEFRLMLRKERHGALENR